MAPHWALPPGDPHVMDEHSPRTLMPQSYVLVTQPPINNYYGASAGDFHTYEYILRSRSDGDTVESEPQQK